MKSSKPLKTFESLYKIYLDGLGLGVLFIFRIYICFLYKWWTYNLHNTLAWKGKLSIL